MKTKFLLTAFILAVIFSSCGDKNRFSFNDFPELIPGTWEYQYQRVLIKHNEKIDSMVINPDNIKFQLKVDIMQVAFFPDNKFIISLINNEDKNKLLRQNGTWKLNNDSLQMIFDEENAQFPQTYFCEISKDTTLHLKGKIAWDDDTNNNDEYTAILKKIK